MSEWHFFLGIIDNKFNWKSNTFSWSCRGVYFVPKLYNCPISLDCVNLCHFFFFFAFFLLNFFCFWNHQPPPSPPLHSNWQTFYKPLFSKEKCIFSLSPINPFANNNFTHTLAILTNKIWNKHTDEQLHCTVLVHGIIPSYLPPFTKIWPPFPRRKNWATLVRLDF